MVPPFTMSIQSVSDNFCDQCHFSTMNTHYATV